MPPVATTLNVVLVPTHSKTLIGSAVIIGGSVTVTEASSLVTSPHGLPASLTITW